MDCFHDFQTLSMFSLFPWFTYILPLCPDKYLPPALIHKTWIDWKSCISIICWPHFHAMSVSFRHYVAVPSKSRGEILYLALLVIINAPCTGNPVAPCWLSFHWCQTLMRWTIWSHLMWMMMTSGTCKIALYIVINQYFRRSFLYFLSALYAMYALKFSPELIPRCRNRPLGTSRSGWIFDLY